MCSKRVKYGVTVIGNLCPWGDDTGGDTRWRRGGGQEGTRVGHKERVGRKSLAPPKRFCNIAPWRQRGSLHPDLSSQIPVTEEAFGGISI